jgi:hypothetical protein
MKKIWLTKRKDEKISLSKGKEARYEKWRVKRYSALGENFKQH